MYVDLSIFSALRLFFGYCVHGILDYSLFDGFFGLILLSAVLNEFVNLLVWVFAILSIFEFVCIDEDL